MSTAFALRHYFAVTAAYWAFTITDGALRMLVVLHFHQLGYSAFEVAMLFLFYEFFGIVTNLTGGWLGARIGLNRTLYGGLALQVLALGMLMAPAALLTVPYVMASQALSGIAKDLSKMSAKSSVKLFIAEDDDSRLFRWVAALTGSKNALKGVGFFLGGLLLAVVGFRWSVGIMAAVIAIVLVAVMLGLPHDIGKSRFKPKFSQVFSKSARVNILSAARFFLFGARDVWFVVALPVYLQAVLDWSHTEVGGFLALWIIGYGFIQAATPRALRHGNNDRKGERRIAVMLAMVLALVMLGIPLAMKAGLSPAVALIGGLGIFGVVFALNSSLHSYLIVVLAERDGVSLDVGFYYMANAGGRLVGTLLSGLLYQLYGQFHGLAACLLVSAAFAAISALIIRFLPVSRQQGQSTVDTQLP
jgi:predicted MFS family arabinose efflux permease